jgi:hypothetical protein
MRKKNNTKRPHLKAVTANAPPVEREELTVVHIPQGVRDTETLAANTVTSDYPELGIFEGDILVTLEDAQLRNYDLATVATTTGETHLGHYHSCPGGYVRLEEDAEEYYIFKPSDIQLIARVMHVERNGKVVKKYPLD